MAERIQRRRTKGWRLPEGAIYVGRPTRWGNPWEVGQVVGADIDSSYIAGAVVDAALAVALYRRALTGPQMSRNVNAGLAVQPIHLAVLRGHDLVCWCPLDQPCHADVLLDLANRG